jgi:NitT/TauT family transport system substrate-binding protein
MVKRSALVMLLILAMVVPLLASGQQGETKPGTLTKLTVISPRGSLEVMDDYLLWVALDMGYFKEEGLDVSLEPGPMDGFATTKFVDQKKADIGYPSPGILTSSVDTGMDVIMVYELMMDQVFDFAVPKDSPIQTVKDLAGKTISVADAGWQVIIDPMLVEAGVDPKSVTYVAVGALWGQTVSEGKADAALTWKGLRAQWDAQGLNLRYILGETFSKMPANGFCARKSDLKDPAKKAILERFMRASSKGIYFARKNPRAAAQITYSQFAAVREQMKPQLALNSMQQLHWGYTGGARKGQGYGWFDLNAWNTYLDIIYKLGQTKKRLAIDDVATNELIKAANNFDKAKVEQDAKNFKLNDEWKDVAVTGDW